MATATGYQSIQPNGFPAYLQGLLQEHVPIHDQEQARVMATTTTTLLRRMYGEILRLEQLQQNTAAAADISQGEAQAAQAAQDLLQTQIVELKTGIQHLEGYRYFYSQVLGTLKNIYKLSSTGNTTKASGKIATFFSKQTPRVLTEAEFEAYPNPQPLEQPSNFRGGSKKQRGGDGNNVKSEKTYENLSANLKTNFERNILSIIPPKKNNGTSNMTNNQISQIVKNTYALTKNGDNLSLLRIKLGQELASKGIKRDTDFYLKIIQEINPLPKNTLETPVEPISSNSEILVKQANETIKQLKSNINGLKNMTGINFTLPNSKITLTENIKKKFKSIKNRINQHRNKIPQNIINSYLPLQLKIKEAEADEQSGGKRKYIKRKVETVKAKSKTVKPVKRKSVKSKK